MTYFASGALVLVSALAAPVLAGGGAVGGAGSGGVGAGVAGAGAAGVAGALAELLGSFVTVGTLDCCVLVMGSFSLHPARMTRPATIAI